ncbi:MAG: dihydropteroate synthase [Fimbriimonadaceae bacterium]|nr:dihydropteroate synthase [Fimbriimonadaceae bacterium]
MSDRPVWIMGVLNVTPDSFSDGGRYVAKDRAVEHGVEMWGQGADIVDVGGESTRPGAAPVGPEEETRRVLPVVEALVAQGVRVSVDTSKGSVAEACLKAGAWMVNDVTAGSDPALLAATADHGAHLCLMHMQGDPRTMQVDPAYGDVVREVKEFLVERAEMATDAGVARDQIWIDPGIGFGKNVRHNLLLVEHLEELVATGFPVLVGASRKSFLGKLGGGESAADRLAATIAVHTLAQYKGARALRVHDVEAAKRASALVTATQSADNP